VLRAAATAGLALVALASGRSTVPVAALAVAVIAIVVFRPGIVFAAGFHLSVAATLGIILLAPLFGRIRGPRAIVLLLAATLGAQIAVAPVLLATFGEVSLIAPVANLVAAPAVAITTIAGLVSGVVNGVAPQLTPIAVGVGDLGARWILWVARVSASIPGAAVALPRASAIAAALVALGAVLWARRVTPVTSFAWAVLDASGAEIERTEAFATKDEAEAWMGSEWSTLLERGGESVVLYEGDKRHYQMGLREA
ncbi:MAG: ComEC/Rec2 family competence protein, partial [Actinomycetota bacterium]|nr:ComEC/Rec2 family competence protein [Actinomycetota bacterium]